MLKQIYLDIDGVLNAWQLYQLREFGVDISYDDWPENFGWDICGVYNHFAGESWTYDDFWSGVTYDHWVDAPRSEIFDKLIERSAKLVGKENVFLATSPTRDPDCAAGKTKWVQGHCPKWLHQNLMIGSKKHLMSQPGRLLIDDADHNIDAWTAEGGLGLLVPRPWNRNRKLNTVEAVDTWLDYFSRKQ